MSDVVECFEEVTVNVSGKVRKETFNGQSYLVAPMTLLQGGRVLDGSQGPLFYPHEEVAKNPGVWNNIPITNGHPTDESGKPTWARDWKVLNQFQLGHVFNDQWDGQARTADGWFNEEWTRNRAPKIYEKLTKGESFDISTGLKTKNYVVRNGSQAHGKVYGHIAKEYGPDHLAALSDQRGACSRKDGCGVLVGNSCEHCGKTPDKTDVTNEEKKSLWKQLGEWLGVAAEGKTVTNEIPKTNEEKTMPTQNKKEELVAHLTTNCACWKGKEKTLNALDEETLNTMKIQQDLILTQRDDIAANTLVVNALRESDPKLKDVALNELPAAFKKKKVKPGCEDEEEMTSKKMPAMNQLKPASERLTPEEIETLEIARDVTQNSKAQLLDLVVNANGKDEASRKAVRPIFEKLGYKELKSIADSLPKTTRNSNGDSGDHGEILLNFFGAGGVAPTANRSTEPDPNDTLEPYVSVDHKPKS